MRFFLNFLRIALFSPALAVYGLLAVLTVVIDLATLDRPDWSLMIISDLGFVFVLYSFFILLYLLEREGECLLSPVKQGCTPAGGVGDECPDVNSCSSEPTGGVTTPEAHSCRASGYESSEGAHRV